MVAVTVLLESDLAGTDGCVDGSGRCGVGSGRAGMVEVTVGAVSLSSGSGGGVQPLTAIASRPASSLKLWFLKQRLD
ncbi:hypothetical protein [Oxynema aestuarii]|uniref:Uncharacterized protein n=1 Tax=Oxynema aestuarii AP17 TaxID=2064643 RepID=A0A6H1TYV2_9CYAN|nr:hypothetical protein [Oxynema aestuarii]QIZ70943.1 hypothetical protein HCG48_10370 [Oxynema aestuarii AP17]